jgi:trans-2,3-dihydro-3-hydroxyanthranilate isomerase
MRSLSFYWLDVFASDAVGGDPLVVVDAADALEPAQMRMIAAEFGVGATAFLLEPREPTHSARLRAFTPIGERRVEGGPLVGAIALLAQLRASDLLGRHGVSLRIEDGDDALAGEARKTQDGSLYASAAIPIPPHPSIAPERVATQLATALSLEATEIGFAAHRPAFCGSAAHFLFAPVAHRAALARACMRGPQIDDLIGDRADVCLYTMDAVDPASAIDLRVLSHADNLGTLYAPDAAAIAFAAVAATFERPEDGEHEIVIDRRDAAGRRARTMLSMSIAQGALVAVAVGGRVRRFGEGVLRL